MKKINFFLFFFLLVISSPAQKPIWQQPVGDITNRVSWIKQSDFGRLICATTNGIYAIDNTTGTEIWKNKELPFGADTDGEFITGTPLMVVEYESATGKGRTAILDILQGKLVYNSKEEGVKVADSHKLTEAGGLLLETIKSKKQLLTFIDMNAGKEKWTIEMGSEKAGIGVGSLMRKIGAESFLAGDPFVSAEGYLVVAYKEKLMAISPDNGKLVWETEMKKDIKTYVFSTDRKLIFTGADDRFEVFNSADGKSFLEKPVRLKGDFNNIMPYNENYIVMHSNGFNIWDVNKMAFQWQKERKIGDMSEITICPTGFAGVHNEEKGSTIYFMDKDGKNLWEESLGDPVMAMFATPKGVWYVTERRSNVLSFEKGKDLWKKDVKLKGVPSMAFDRENKQIVVYADEKLYRVDLEEVNMSVLTEEAGLKEFDESKASAGVEIRKDGYIITSSQNICFIDRDGKILFNNHFKEVGLSKGLRTGLNILGGAVAVVGATNSFKDYMSSPGSYKSTNGVVDLDDPYNKSQMRTSTQATNTAGDAMFAIASQRYAATKSVKDYVYILTKFEDGTKGLIKVNKDNGKEQKRFLFNDKEPVYVVDEVTNMLFLVEKDKNILCFSTE